MVTHDEAKRWRDQGISVIPVGWRSKRPAFDALRLTGNGRGPTWEQYRERLPTDEELRMWFAGPKRNLGIVTGTGGLTVLDFDSLEVYAAWQAWAEATGNVRAMMAATTYQVKSARGLHLYFVTEHPSHSLSIGLIDVKAQWGYVLAPPSVHPAGVKYQTRGGRILRIDDIARLLPERIRRDIQYEEPSNDPWEVASQGGASVPFGAVQDIKRRWSLEMLLPDLAQSWQANGKALVRCPLHDDRHPSLLVYADGWCQCMAGCNDGRQMDVISLYAALHRMTNREAIVELSTAETMRKRRETWLSG